MLENCKNLNSKEVVYKKNCAYKFFFFLITARIFYEKSCFKLLNNLIIKNYNFIKLKLFK